jgi:arsenate reductase
MKKQRVLFVCTHNSARSQMAEAFLNWLAGDQFEAESAGLEPGELNPLVMQVMREVGFDLKDKKAESVFEFFKQGRLYNHIIYVCEKETEEKCPVFPGIGKAHSWPFPDPSKLNGSHEEKLEQARKIRDEIKSKIENWIKEYHRISGGEE